MYICTYTNKFAEVKYENRTKKEGFDLNFFALLEGFSIYLRC